MRWRRRLGGYFQVEHLANDHFEISMFDQVLLVVNMPTTTESRLDVVTCEGGVSQSSTNPSVGPVGVPGDIEQTFEHWYMLGSD